MFTLNCFPVFGVFVSFFAICSSVSVNTLFINKLSQPLQLSIAKTNWGSFETRPPQTISPGGQGSWITIGSTIENVGFIEYDVYYNSTEFNGCISVSYLWDLLIGFCDGEFENCPSDTLHSSNITSSSKTGFVTKSLKTGCSVIYKQDCPKWGDPTFTLYSTC